MHNQSQIRNPNTRQANIANPPATHFQRLAQSVLNIAALPSAPTFDWTTKAAHALSYIHPNTTFGIVIALHNHDHNRLAIESTGTCLPLSKPNPTDPDHARCSLERIGSTPMSLTPNQQQSGFITTTSTLFPQWHKNPLGDPWNSQPQSPNPTNNIAAYAPIDLRPLPDEKNTQSSKSLALVVLAKQHQPNDQLDPLDPLDPELLAAAITALTYKATGTICRQHNDDLLWLTQREQTILDLLITGKSVRAIAEIIARSPHTVHDHVKNLHRKLNASSRGQLIANALGHPKPAFAADLINPIIDPILSPQINPPARKPSNYATELKFPQPPTQQSTPQAQSTPAPNRIRATPLNQSPDQPKAAH